FCFVFFFFQAEDGIRDLTVTGVQTCALPIWIGDETDLHGRQRDLEHFGRLEDAFERLLLHVLLLGDAARVSALGEGLPRSGARADRKSTRLNSSHSQISYAVFCLKKKNKKK